MIKVEELRKEFAGLVAVDSICFEVAQGEVLAFLGPNGAGKSTTMKMLAGFLTPTSGQAWIKGKEVSAEPLAVKQLIGYLPESSPSYKNLTVKEFLGFIAKARGLFAKELQTHLLRVMEQTGLTEVQNKTIGTLSKGYRQRVGFAQALVHDPPILILDEPTDGLDPNQKQEMRKLIRSMAPQKAVILSTHNLEEMEAVCNRAIVIHQGRIVFNGTPLELLQKSRHHNEIRITFEGAVPPELVEKLNSLPEVAEVRIVQGSILILRPQGGENLLAAVNHLLFDYHAHLLELYLEKGKLDEVFREITLGESP